MKVRGLYNELINYPVCSFNYALMEVTLTEPLIIYRVYNTTLKVLVYFIVAIFS